MPRNIPKESNVKPTFFFERSDMEREAKEGKDEAVTSQFDRLPADCHVSEQDKASNERGEAKSSMTLLVGL